MPFDVNAARQAGYSDDDILAHLTTSRQFNVEGALKAGYSKQDIINHLATSASRAGDTPQSLGITNPIPVSQGIPPALQGKPTMADLIKTNQASPSPGSFEGKPENVGQYVPESGGQVLSGLSDILHGDFAKGGHKIISGIGVATLPAAPFGIMAAPIPAAIGMGGGMVGETIAQRGAAALGATPDQQAFAGDIGGLAGGIAAPQATAALRAGASRALLLGKSPSGAYESALKPSTTIPAAERARIVATGLQEGIPVSKGGLEKLSSLIDDLNSEIRATIQTNPNAPIPRDASAKIAGVTQRFATQAAPGADLKAIASTAADYNASHPAVMPAEYAQAVKEGTYARIGDRAYGEVGTATTETEKAIARHLKDEIARQFPEIKDLNAREGSALGLQDVLERSVNRISNHQLIGLGTPAAAGAGKVLFGGNKGAAALATMKAVLDNPAVKSRLAIGLMKSGMSAAAANQRVNAYVGALSQVSLRGSLQPDDSLPSQ